MATVVFSEIGNNGISRLNGAINDSTTSVIVDSVTALTLDTSTTLAYLTIIDQTTWRQDPEANPEVLEIVKVTSITGNTCTVVRAQDGTTAKAFADNDIVELRHPAIVTTEIQDALTDGTATLDVAGFTGDIDVGGTSTLANVNLGQGFKMKVGDGVAGFNNLCDDIVISDSDATTGANVGMSILAKTDGNSYLFFGDQANNVASAIQVQNASGVGTMNFNAGTNDLNLRLSGEAGSELAAFTGDVDVDGDANITGQTFMGGNNTDSTLTNVKAVVSTTGSSGRLYLRDLSAGFTTNDSKKDGTYLTSDNGVFAIKGLRSNGSSSSPESLTINHGSNGEATFNSDVDVGGDLITTTKTPASASATGTAGTIAWDASYIYVCTATDTWKRVAIATW